jgi:hypothetical protein
MFRTYPLLLLVPLMAGGDAVQRGFGSEVGSKGTGAAAVSARRSVTNAVPARAAAGGDVLKGRITYDGDLPASGPIKAMEAHKDRDQCLQGEDYEKREQNWIVDKATRGVANVVIWLEPPRGLRFDLQPESLKMKDQEIDQPHCAFIPHVVTLFPAYRDGGRYVSTGQKLVVHNSALMPHNVKVVGDPVRNPQRSITLPPKGKQELVIQFQKQPLRIACDFHPWMSALAFTFDHPYHAVTDLQGNFQINNMPTGVELTVVAWHDSKAAFKRERISFEPGENKLNWKISK